MITYMTMPLVWSARHILPAATVTGITHSIPTTAWVTSRHSAAMDFWTMAAMA